MIKAYEVHYRDQKGIVRIFCTYGTDAYAVKCSAEELLQPGFQILRIKPTDDFDW